MQQYKNLSDEGLLKLAGRDDEAAFEELYNRYWEKLLAIGYFFMHDKQTSEDIVHEVMISLWSRRNQLEIESVSAYLGTAMKFSVFKAIARDKRRRELMKANTTAEQHETIEEQLDARCLQDYLSKTIEQLPPKARLVFKYSRSESLSIAQIAEKMDLSPKAVEYHMTKALRTLRSVVHKIKIFFL